MKILSFDVGIKNLAYCYLEIKENCIKILKWDIIDLSTSKKYSCNNLNCNNKVIYFKDNIYYCNKHIKDKENKKIPNELIIKKNKKINELKELNDKYKIVDKFTNKKKFLYELEIFNKQFFNKMQKENANNINLIDLGIRLKELCNKEFEINNKIDVDIVYIENQISPIANRMKTLQGMLSQYFIMKNINNIYFCSSINKLKNITTKKLNYKERKRISIESTINILNNEIINGKDYVSYFNSNNKKDDLSDSLLQGLYYIKNKCE